MQLQSFMATLNAIFHVEATPVEGSGSALPLLGNADSRLWVEMCCRGCRAPFSSGHRACLDSQANPSCPEPQLGAAAFPGDFFLVFPFWLYIASSYTVSCQHLRPSFSLSLNSGECGPVVGRNYSALAPAEEYAMNFHSGEDGKARGRRWLETHKTVSHRCLVRCWSLWCAGFPLLSCVSFCLYFFSSYALSLHFLSHIKNAAVTWAGASSVAHVLSCLKRGACHVNACCLGQMGWCDTSLRWVFQT